MYLGGYIAEKVPHWYLVQEGDATMFNIVLLCPDKKFHLINCSKKYLIINTSFNHVNTKIE